MARDHFRRRDSNDIFEYVRRVPTAVAHLDSRKKIVKSLGTRDEPVARQKAQALDTANEALWAAMMRGEQSGESWEAYRAAVDLAQAKGFTYRQPSAFTKAEAWDIVERVLAAREAGIEPVQTGILGMAPEPSPRLSDLWRLYTQHAEAELEGMSPNQLRKHTNPRKRAIAYAIEVLTDMDLGKIIRADVLRFRDWWVKKMKAENLRADTINRSFSDIKGMLSVVDNALHTSYGAAWEKSHIKPTNKTRNTKRPPFPTDFVRDRFLAPGALDNLNLEARTIVYLMVETGMRPSEACNLRPEDIHLEAAIPFVSVATQSDRRLKNEYSERAIPLVGVSLWALRQCPKGFPTYRDKEDTLSNTVNKALAAAKLRPTKAHVLYSLRHTFADRLTAARVSDREHTDLMGHEFDRPDYGDGTALAQKLEIIQSIAFTPPWLPEIGARR